MSSYIHDPRRVHEKTRQELKHKKRKRYRVYTKTREVNLSEAPRTLRRHPEEG